MAKGLIRSLGRAAEADQKIIRKQLPISGSLDITGVADTVDAGTFQIADLPEGNILLLGVVAVVDVTAGADTHVIDNWNGDFGIGIAPNADVDLGDAGDVEFIASTALDAGASDKIAATVRATNVTVAMINNTENDLEINFNLLIDDNVITDAEDGTFAVSGTLDLAYIVLGDD